MVRSHAFIGVVTEQAGVQIRNLFAHLNFRYMATNPQTYTRVKQYSHASVGLAQARPNY